MNNNQLLLIEPTQQEPVEINELEGLHIKFVGAGSKVIIEKGCVFNNTNITIDSDSQVFIKNTGLPGINNTNISMEGSPNSLLEIGKGFSTWGCFFGMANEANLSVKIGDNCMFSSGIIIRATDGHTIIDKLSRQVINHASPVILGKHVWVGENATILKGSHISDNSIVATCAVVTKKFVKPNVVLAGNPAIIVKTGIEWDRRYIKQYETDQENVFSVNDENIAQPVPCDEINFIQKWMSYLYGILFYPFFSTKKRSKLKSNPQAFFKDSKNSFTRLVGKLLRII